LNGIWAPFIRPGSQPMLRCWVGALLGAVTPPAPFVHGWGKSWSRGSSAFCCPLDGQLDGKNPFHGTHPSSEQMWPRITHPPLKLMSDHPITPIQRIIESLMLEKTSKINKSNHQAMPAMPTQPCPSVPHLHSPQTPPGMVTPPPPWAACSNAWPRFQRRYFSSYPTWTSPGTTWDHYLSSFSSLNWADVVQYHTSFSTDTVHDQRVMRGLISAHILPWRADIWSRESKTPPGMSTGELEATWGPAHLPASPNHTHGCALISSIPTHPQLPLISTPCLPHISEVFKSDRISFFLFFIPPSMQN